MYGQPVQDTYDGVVANTLSLLKGWTLDQRAATLKEEAKAVEVRTLRAF